MLNSPEVLASRLQEEGAAVLAFFDQLTPTQWDQEVYPSGEDGTIPWRVREVLAHFIAAEQGFHQLLQNVAAAGGGVQPEFDVDAYNRHTVPDLSQLEHQALLGQYAMVRERTVALTRAFEPEQLALMGRHPASAGEVTLSDMVRITYNHNKIHLRDVRRALKPVQPEGSAWTA
jgi:hypothetical protein